MDGVCKGKSLGRACGAHALCGSPPPPCPGIEFRIGHLGEGNVGASVGGRQMQLLEGKGGGGGLGGLDRNPIDFNKAGV